MATWRNLTLEDIRGLLQVAEQVHPELPESVQMFTERVKLFPDGCLALVKEDTICGYAISHPIRKHRPPALDSLLGQVAPDADQYYIHDLAILPELRGQGLAEAAVKRLFDVAKRYPTSCLISVYGTASFWGRFGFEPRPADPALAEKLQDYGEDATYLERQNQVN